MICLTRIARICYATVVEDEAIEQIRRMCDYEFTLGSKIRIMPDVHTGKGCTMGKNSSGQDQWLECNSSNGACIMTSTTYKWFVDPLG